MSAKQPEHLGWRIRDFVEHRAGDVGHCGRCLPFHIYQVQDAAAEILRHDDRRGVGIADWRMVALLAVDALECERGGVHEDEDEDEPAGRTAAPSAFDDALPEEAS